MIPRFNRSGGWWKLQTGLLAAVAVLGLAASSHACGNSGGGSQGRGGGSGGRGGGAGGVGQVAGGVTSAQSAAVAYSNQAQFQNASNQYVAGMQAQHSRMLQQIHQRQAQQLAAIRQSHLNKKNTATSRPVSVSYKPASKTVKPS